MVMPVKMAIEACRAFNNQIIFKDQFDSLVNRLGKWTTEHENDLAAAYLTLRDAGLLFLVVLSGKEFNASVEAAMTDLDLEIANDSDYNLIRLAVHALPKCSEEELQSFLSRRMALRFSINGERS